MSKIYIKTFGCQMNMYDSARMRDALGTLGYETTDNPAEADILLLNTCHIREKASEKLFSEIGRLNEFKSIRAKEKKNTLIIVCGCVVQAEGAEILQRAHAVDIAVGPQNYHRLPELVARYNRKKGRVLEADFPADSKFDYLPKTKATSASCFLAVQEGCDNFCTYCVVPYTRGCEYSRSADEIIQEAKDLVSTGAKEIMLLGQNVNCWHGDGASDLGELIYRIAEIDGLERIRYTTSYPSKITENLVRAHAEVEKLMPYIHLPIQSGSDSVLKAMNRLYTASEYIDIIGRFREARPDIAISSDFIVGFPGETDKDFEQTLEVVKKVKYTSSFSFKYSPRPGTPASLMKNQIPEDVKTERLMRLQALLLEQQKEAYEAVVGKVLPVLLTEKGKKDGQLIGYTPYLQSTHVSLDDSYLNKIVSLKITKASATSLSSELSCDIKKQ
ncbi:MAG: tRNA (N6-isopentenyl adenosine(37)-C2)-methylthiotransferase MiaB [Alphaproteobacteria bacterium]|nr:tRNA (N6-isopentenyl adenosine(37)-C2)-methylthiotransferase MiaB [Alphaproteobacteria bacterium]MBQ3117675.1 tRNA (N6-isopentenyl adenosine(37)-C2)-methylthiotransferase MiaB [Alphaproteobacteria bacterium]MBQ8557813.1 tRNA (N6-isopentenyl adenosine(37)-C2)-methylthiotransferase MiaB [Alphaproteobacteria bacterium]